MHRSCRRWTRTAPRCTASIRRTSASAGSAAGCAGCRTPSTARWSGPPTTWRCAVRCAPATASWCTTAARWPGCAAGSRGRAARGGRGLHLVLLDVAPEVALSGQAVPGPRGVGLRLRAAPRGGGPAGRRGGVGPAAEGRSCSAGDFSTGAAASALETVSFDVTASRHARACARRTSASPPWLVVGSLARWRGWGTGGMTHDISGAGDTAAGMAGERARRGAGRVGRAPGRRRPDRRGARPQPGVGPAAQRRRPGERGPRHPRPRSAHRRARRCGLCPGLQLRAGVPAGASAPHMSFTVAPAREFARGLPPQLGIAVNPDGTVGVPLPPPAVAELCREGRDELDRSAERRPGAALRAGLAGRAGGLPGRRRDWSSPAPELS